jgi:hypothetical protein
MRMNVRKVTKAERRDWSQHSRGAELTPSRGVVRYKAWEQRWGNKPTSQNGASGGSLSWSCGSEGGTQNWISTPWWRKRWPDKSWSYRAMQLLLGENNSSDHLSWTGSELPQTPFAICPADRRKQILLTSQSPGETTSEFLLVMDSL